MRLGGESHHALVEPLERCPPGLAALLARSDRSTAATNSPLAYVLSPGLAEVAPATRMSASKSSGSTPCYGLYPTPWQTALQGCVGDRPLLLGGVTQFRQDLASEDQNSSISRTSLAFLPQRAFVPPGTIYRFRSEPVPSPCDRLLPVLSHEFSPSWLHTLHALHYGQLLWGC